MNPQSKACVSMNSGGLSMSYRMNVRLDSTSDLRIKQQPRITREKSRKLKISKHQFTQYESIFQLDRLYSEISLV